jgi:molecular chaperone GrpE
VNEHEELVVDDDGPHDDTSAEEADLSAPPDPEVDLPTAVAQRDEYLALARQVQADFENFRKRAHRQQEDAATAATGRLVESLLPVLDALDSAALHGVEGVGPLHSSLLDVLTRAGLAVVGEADVPFDPTVHDAVMHEPGDGDGPSVAEVLRTGYQWNGRTLRAAMVRVKD